MHKPGSREGGRRGGIADGFSRNVVDVCRGQSGLEWRPLAGHAVTLDLSILLGPRSAWKSTRSRGKESRACVKKYRGRHLDCTATGSRTANIGAKAKRALLVAPRARPTRYNYIPWYILRIKWPPPPPSPPPPVFCSLFETSRELYIYIYIGTPTVYTYVQTLCAPPRSVTRPSISRANRFAV